MSIAPARFTLRLVAPLCSVTLLVCLGVAAENHPPSKSDAVVGLWGGKIETKIEGGTLNSFVVGIDRAMEGTDYTASSRADVTLTESQPASKVVVITTYKGVAKGGDVFFESIERKRSSDGSAGILLVPASMRATFVDGHIELRVGNDDEGYTDFTLAPKKDHPAAPAPLDPVSAIRGSWGGNMSKADLGDNVYLDELFIDVPPAGPWRASVRMNVTLKRNTAEIPIVILAEYDQGRVEGASVHWEIVAWHRTVPSTGQKTDIVGNPLVLTPKPDGSIAGKFEGADGYTFTLSRKSLPPRVP